MTVRNCDMKSEWRNFDERHAEIGRW